MNINKINRGFKVVAEFQNSWIDYPDYYNDWKPTEESLQIIKQRIQEKLLAKPHIYRKYGQYIFK